MNEIKRRKAKVESVVRIWDFHARRLRQINFGERFKKWSEAQVAAFRDPESEFNELCAHGCQKEVLLILLYAVRHATRLADFWEAMAGSPKKREKTSKVLERATVTLKDSFEKVLVLEDEEARRQLPEMDRIPPSLLIAELELYIDYFRLAENLKIDTKTRSPTVLATFLLTNYVVRAPGRPHDRITATLLADVQDREYDEIAQRMWRNRNYNRLKKHHSKLGEFIFVLSVVISVSVRV